MMTTLGKYELHEQLGRGGFGTVYRAVDTTLGREVALKVLHPQLTTDPEFLERFRNEARMVASMHDPYIVTIYDLAEADGRVFIAMEYLPGGSLKDRVEKEGAFPFVKAARIMKDICSGLAEAHAQGLVHRDLKPANILFNKNGRAVVGDFGLARAIQNSSAAASSSSGAVGTPAYRAPELWMGRPPASPATDIYSLACVLSEMLTGKVLFDGASTDVVITQHLVSGPVIPEHFPTEVPPGVRYILRKSLAREQQNRYGDVNEFMHALELKSGETPDAGDWESNVRGNKLPSGVEKPKKEKQPLELGFGKPWMWIIGLVAAAGLVWLLIQPRMGKTAPAPTYTPAPVQKIAPTLAPTDVIEPTPAPIPTVEAVFVEPPDQFVRRYWSLVDEQECEAAWDLQTTEFRVDTYEEYEDWCRKWDQVELDQVELVSMDGEEVKFFVKVDFLLSGKSYPFDMDLYVVSDGNDSWLVSKTRQRK